MIFTRKYFLIVFSLVCSGKIFAQQVPQFVQYYINPFVINPSLAGYSEKSNAYFIRNQKYLGFDGGNVSNILTVDGKIFEDQLGFGISLFSDQMGALSTQGASLSLSYAVKFSETSRLGFGLSGGITDRRFDLGNVVVKDPNDPMLQMNFPARKSFADMAAGIYFDMKDFQIGISIPQLLANNIEYEGGSTNLDRHYILHARYKYKVSEANQISLIPFAKMMYLPGAPLQYDINLTADMQNIGWVNMGYRSDYAVSANAGVRIKKNLMLGYAYHFVMNTTKNYGPVNQEILIGYTFGARTSDKEKRELEALQRENERLEEELRRQEEKNKTLRDEQKRKEEDLKKREEELKKKEEEDKAVRDSLQKTEEKLRQLENEKKELEKKLSERPATTDKTQTGTTDKTQTGTTDKTQTGTTDKTQTGTTDKTEKEYETDTKKFENDNFLEKNKDADAPKGYYVVAGAFGKIENAESFFDKIKSDFPEARIIFNQRNNLYYVVLGYSTEKKPVFQIHQKAHQRGLNKAWVLDY